MIQSVQDREALASFARAFVRAGGAIHGVDTPEQLQNNLMGCLDRPEDLVLGCYEAGRLESVFSLLVEKEERYLEVLVTLTHSREHCTQVLDCLRKTYPGYTLDCVLHPDQRPALEALEAYGAHLDPVQLTLRREGEAPACSDRRVVPVAQAYREGYAALHGTDCYWTARRVLDAPHMFRVLLALEGGTVVGYIDCTLPHEENEIYDLFVRPDCRRRGLGTALVAAALAENAPRAMSLCVAEDDAGTLALCRELGFRPVPGRESRTAQLTL